MENNMKAMREALVAVKKSIDGIGSSSLDCDPEILMASLTQVCARLSARIDAALASPRLNCEVGTAQEQAQRFEVFCNKNKDPEAECLNCPLLGLTGGHCELAWAQMPYTEGGAS